MDDRKRSLLIVGGLALFGAGALLWAKKKKATEEVKPVQVPARSGLSVDEIERAMNAEYASYSSAPAAGAFASLFRSLFGTGAQTADQSAQTAANAAKEIATPPWAGESFSMSNAMNTLVNHPAFTSSARAAAAVADAAEADAAGTAAPASVPGRLTLPAPGPYYRLRGNIGVYTMPYLRALGKRFDDGAFVPLSAGDALAVFITYRTFNDKHYDNTGRPLS